MKQTLLGIGSFVFPLIIIVIIVAVMIIMPNIDPDSEIPGVYRPFVVIILILSLIAVEGTWFYIIYDIIHSLGDF